MNKPHKNITFLVFLFLTTLVFGQDTYLDNFNTLPESYSQNDGTLNFATNWAESESTSPTGGRIRIVSSQLRFNNLDGRTITRTLDLSAASAVTLTLDYDATSRGNEGLRVRLYNSSTSSYETIATINTTTSGSITHTLTANQISNSSRIRFQGVDNNWSGSETIFVDNVQFSVPSSNIAPVLTTTGDQVYCPGTTIPVVETISITDADDTTADEVSVQISSGYINGEDLLALTGSHPTITATWSASEGKLTLAGPATLTAFEAAVSAVVYSSSATNPTGTRGFSITVGDANFLPSTGHYYEFISNVGITWTAANAAASLRTYYGLQGYLATLTSQTEADFSGSQATGVGWIGGSDATTEGVWQWVTGPEAGTTFWNGTAGGSTPNFAFWNTGEPNQAGNEDYAHITDNSVGIQGSWNDLPNAGGGGAYAPQGYVVEYGGTTGDPVLSISGTTMITMDNVDPTASDPAGITVECIGDVPASDITVVTDEADNCSAAANIVVAFVGDSALVGSNPGTITRTYSVTDEAGNSITVTQDI
ncbi:C-type lectin domain-containing protein, partial [Spongiimicrobium sp. 3-5]|uniref:C-type lectin domain-containing protein n=1 Tax=Spongiimicrobium sp. 3-5 TaxID=3332596 RepID=UPI00397FA37B